MQNTKRALNQTYMGNQIKTLLDKLKIQDIHNLYRENKLQYTSKRRHYLTRIDRIYTNIETKRNIITYKIKPNFFSDHQALTIKLKWGIREKWGKGLWKLNSDILSDENYKKEIINAIEIHKINKQIDKNSFILWDKLKERIKEISIEFSIKKRREERLKEEELQDRLEKITIEYEKDNKNLEKEN